MDFILPTNEVSRHSGAAQIAACQDVCGQSSDTLQNTDVRAVDPRDQTWEISPPKYRVYFSDENGAADEYEVERADVAGVMAWAEAQRNGRAFALYACVPYDGLGLLRLKGSDPNAR
jgi:hypothetical protein